MSSKRLPLSCDVVQGCADSDVRCCICLGTYHGVLFAARRLSATSGA